MRYADQDSLRRLQRRQFTAWALVVGLVLAVVVGAAFGLGEPTTERLASSTPSTAPATAEPVDLSAEAPQAEGDARPSIEDYRGPDWITTENAEPGTTAWQIPDDPRMWEKVRGFADTTSIDFGESFVLRVSTAAPTWRVDAYRIGYYGGGGGRLIWSSPEQPGKAQSYGVVDQATNMREARWDPSLEVQTDGTWPPGQYLLKLVSSDGGASFVPLVVRDDESPAPSADPERGDHLAGLQPLGRTRTSTPGPTATSATRSRVVSFDRPYGGNGSGEFLGREFEFIWFVERLGFDVTLLDRHRPRRAARAGPAARGGASPWATTSTTPSRCAPPSNGLATPA